MFEYLESPLIHWKDYGGSGRPIVMVHGLGGSIANWDLVGPKLTGLGHVTALDLPGFGLSPPAKDWSVQTQVATLVDFLEHFGPPVVLIGNSLGGLISEMVAATEPELVDALILIAPATPPRFPDPYIHWPTARRLLLNAAPVVGPAISRRMLATMTPRQLINESLARITHKPGHVPLDLVESFVELAEARAHFPWAAEAIPRVGQSIRKTFLRRSRFVSMIRDIKAPTLIIQGISDPIISRTSCEWLCWIRPDWDLVQLEDTGHTPQIDAPIRTVGVIESWLGPRLSREMSA
jgi:pimeloyl-ACP methyl ester carboxylesterase